ncbi:MULTISPECIES: hypothetical protein [unclassified Acinetobacter]|uniref:hypothetical protein n=1 Tax=unclassified Acinetobacter TaxID=196816 RepID=UPI00244B1E76|nr:MULTISPECIES: hypothetical protein [unclassified Acinetobacter]MDH0032053.1 hypothetical protein [Acinetobacter sp. GD04021]MDH0887709.1 hypothetical protein [Acinetobacter sp. GD03873]MDH1084057.1 hypothetical protein [Acinetobacter sp. GD03983]MDH2191016.1 hypothetical protein [Acinetobacter sp. GD03645]MDH2204569.1 hypothetical protein [Acinetobacter sp. GD03647]
MDIQKEKIAHEKHLLSQGVDFKYLPNIQYNELENVYELIEWGEEYSEALNEINSSWCTWQAAKAHEAKKLDGCVVAQKDQIETWWQDAEEPENFATKEDDLSFIAQHIQDDEVMEINEHHTIHLPSITKFGAWVYQNGQRKFFVGTKDEVEAVINESKALIEAHSFFEAVAKENGNEQ